MRKPKYLPLAVMGKCALVIPEKTTRQIRNARKPKRKLLGMSFDSFRKIVEG